MLHHSNALTLSKEQKLLEDVCEIALLMKYYFEKARFST